MATWALDENVSHLNHGSFGATPIEVLVHQGELRSVMEANPVSFMLETYQPALDEVRNSVASFVGADSGGVVFVPNATYGVNSVLRSMEDHLAPGAEIMVTDHGYNACTNAVRVSAEKAQCDVVVAEIPLPVVDVDGITRSILDRVTNKTALVVIDHVTSPTGLIMPVAEIVQALEPDIPVLIDGAHAPGMVPIYLESLGASFYAANCHKWMCAPKGSGFLYVSPRHRDRTYSVAVSHGYNGGWPGGESRFHDQFDWTGTDDPTARLSVGFALEVMGSHRPDGWDGIRSSNHQLVLDGRAVINSKLGARPLIPDAMIGSIASIEIPPQPGESKSIFDPLMLALRHEHHIEVPVFNWPDQSRRLLRISAQQYNDISQYERLADALVAEMASIQK